MLGFSAEQTVGLRCHEAVAGVFPGGSNSECLYGCPFLRILRAGDVPVPRDMQFMGADGAYRLISITPMVVSDPEHGSPLMLHLLAPRDVSGTQGAAAAPPRSEPLGRPPVLVAQQAADAARSAGYQALSARELEVLKLVGKGWSTERIAEELEISVHTVRNHVRHFRRKLEAKTKLDAVLTGIRLGILSE